MKAFILALQFLTVIPTSARLEGYRNKLPQAMIYFPLIGLLLGAILAAANKVLSFIPLGELPTYVILLILLIVLTGGLHLDGLADTSDALLSRKSRSDMLKIMRDPHIGTMGMLSLISIILLKISLLSALNAQLVNNSLIVMCVLSRYALVLAIFSFPYAREEGKAKAFVIGKSLKIFLLASAMSLLFALFFLGSKGAIIFIAVTLFTILIGKFISQKIGGMTGDTLGATNELTEVFVLFNILILSSLKI